MKLFSVLALSAALAPAALAAECTTTQLLEYASCISKTTSSACGTASGCGWCSSSAFQTCTMTNSVCSCKATGVSSSGGAGFCMPTTMTCTISFGALAGASVGVCGALELTTSNVCPSFSTGTGATTTTTAGTTATSTAAATATATATATPSTGTTATTVAGTTAVATATATATPAIPTAFLKLAVAIDAAVTSITNDSTFGLSLRNAVAAQLAIAVEFVRIVSAIAAELSTATPTPTATTAATVRVRTLETGADVVVEITDANASTKASTLASSTVSSDLAALGVRSVAVTANPATTNDDNDDDLSDGAIAGIVIGCIVGVMLIGALSAVALSKSKAAASPAATPTLVNTRSASIADAESDYDSTGDYTYSTDSSSV
jgi:hypothetical protein